MSAPYQPGAEPVRPGRGVDPLGKASGLFGWATGSKGRLAILAAAGGSVATMVLNSIFGGSQAAAPSPTVLSSLTSYGAGASLSEGKGFEAVSGQEIVVRRMSDGKANIEVAASMVSRKLNPDGSIAAATANPAGLPFTIGSVDLKQGGVVVATAKCDVKKTPAGEPQSVQNTPAQECDASFHAPNDVRNLSVVQHTVYANARGVQGPAVEATFDTMGPH